jgi:short-subunit dehydrogenase
VSYDYKGKVAIVTGASSGIGRAIALDLASRGTTVIAAARRKEMLDEVVAKCRQRAPASEAVPTDVQDRSAVESLVRGAIERHASVDVLVNNAGISMRKHVTRLSVEDVERVMNVNFMSMVYATLAVLPSMIERKQGHIVNISSIAGRIGSPRESAYSASKWAMSGFTEVLAGDLDKTGVKLHVIYPGPIDTEIWSKVEEPAAYRGKLYPPERVAAGVRECLEQGKFEIFVPKQLGFAALARTVAPKSFIRGTARYDRRARR